jgi:hypothetical protein
MFQRDRDRGSIEPVDPKRVDTLLENNKTCKSATILKDYRFPLVLQQAVQEGVSMTDVLKLVMVMAIAKPKPKPKSVSDGLSKAGRATDAFWRMFYRQPIATVPILVPGWSCRRRNERRRLTSS